MEERMEDKRTVSKRRQIFTFPPSLKSLSRTDLVLREKEGHNKIWIFSCSMYHQVKRFPACNHIIVSTCKEWCAINSVKFFLVSCFSTQLLPQRKGPLRWQRYTQMKGKAQFVFGEGPSLSPFRPPPSPLTPPLLPQLGTHKMLTQMVFWNS